MREEVPALFLLPFPELMFEPQPVHRLNFDPLEVQISTLLSIKNWRLSGGLRLSHTVGQI